MTSPLGKLPPPPPPALPSLSKPALAAPRALPAPAGAVSTYAPPAAAGPVALSVNASPVALGGPTFRAADLLAHGSADIASFSPATQKTAGTPEEASATATASADAPAEASAASAAQDDVEVSDDGVEAELEAVQTEASTAAEDTRADAAEMERRAADPSSGVTEGPYPGTYCEEIYNEEGEVIGTRYVDVNDGDTYVRESTLQEDGTFTVTERTVEEDGTVQQTTYTGVDQDPYFAKRDGWFNSNGNPDATWTSTEWKPQEGGIVKTESRHRLDEQGQWVDETAQVSLRRASVDEAGVPYGTEGAFSGDSDVVVRTVTLTSTSPQGYSESSQTTWSQENVRVTEAQSPMGPQITIEKQVSENQKVTQQYLIDSQQATVSTTTVNGDTTTTDVKVWDTSGGGRPGEPGSELIGEGTTTRRYGPDGIVAHEETHGRMHRYPFTEVDYVLDRRVEGGQVIYDSTTTIRSEGVNSTQTVHQEATLGVDPETGRPIETPSYTRVEVDGNTLEMHHRPEGVEATYTAEGQTYQARVYQEDGAVVAEINGKKVVFGADGSISGADELTDEELNLLPLVIDGQGGVASLLGAADSSSVHRAIGSRYGSRMRGAATMFEGVGAILTAWSGISNFRKGNYDDAGADAISTTGSILNLIDENSRWAKRLNIIGGGIDIATGAYDLTRSDSWEERGAAGMTMAQGGLAILAVAVPGAGVAAAIGIGVLEVGKMYLQQRQEQKEEEEARRNVPPLAPELLA